MGEDSMYLEALSEWVLDEHKTVTYRWLSHELGVTSNVAKMMLHRFATEKGAGGDSGIQVTYLVSGRSADGARIFRLVPQPELDAVKDKLDSVICVHVYSVHAGKDATDDVAARCWALDFPQRKQLMHDKSSAGDTLRANGFSAIGRNEAIEFGKASALGLATLPPEPSVERKAKRSSSASSGTDSMSSDAAAGAAAAAAAAAKATKKGKTTSAASFFAPRAGSQKAGAKKTKAGASKSSAGAAKKKGKRQGKKGISSFFSKGAAKPAAGAGKPATSKQVEEPKSEPANDVLPMEEDEVEEQKANLDKTGDVDVPKEAIENADDDAKAESKSPKKKAKKLKKRKRLRRRAGDDDPEDSTLGLRMAQAEMEEQADFGGLGMDMRTEEDLERDRAKRAIEREKELAELAEEEKEERDSFFGAKERRGDMEAMEKHLERKLVKKTYMDADGFMVTEEVWEEVECDGPAPNKPKPAAAQKKRKSPSKTKEVEATESPSPAKKKAKKPRKAKKKKADGKQRSIMGFFNKK